MAGRIAIVTDSVACLPREMVKQYDIEVVPIQLNIDGKIYRDGIDIAPDEFYRLLPDVKQSPTSAGALPGVFLETFQRCSQRFDSIFCVTIAAKFSGMLESARQAKQILQETRPEVTIEVFDSSTAAAAQGLVVLAAAKLAERGGGLAEVLAEAQKVAQRVNMLGVLNTLKYLSKSGRVPAAAALAGQLLRIKPIFTLRKGEALPVANSRSIDGAIKHMLGIIEEQAKEEQLLHIAIMHADNIERAMQLKNMIEHRFSNIAELFITEFTPVMGAYTGPGVLAIAYYSGEEL